MKDSEFIELLNLYLDHEISPEKAAVLEAEVTRDPARRELYRQYCRMQKACVVLATQFVDDAPAEAAVFSGRSASRGHAGLWATGLLAAAACAALAILPRLHTAAPALAAPASAALARSVPTDTPPAAPAFNDFHPVFTVHPQAAAPADQFAWIQQVQMAPIGSLSATPLFLSTKPTLDLDNRPEAERSSGAASEEKAAFQFQR